MIREDEVLQEQLMGGLAWQQRPLLGEYATRKYAFLFVGSLEDFSTTGSPMTFALGINVSCTVRNAHVSALPHSTRRMRHCDLRRGSAHYEPRKITSAENKWRSVQEP